MLPKNVTLIQNSTPVGSHDIKLVTQFLVKTLFFIAISFHPAAAQTIQHGTFFVAGFSADYAVVAIDSRETTTVGNNRSTNDRYCKIQPLFHNAFFFARGITSATDSQTQANIFDARDLAHSLYVQFGLGTTKFSELADTWATQMVAIYNTKPDEFARGAVQNIMADGFFVGLDQSGNIGFGGQIIKYNPLGFPRFVHNPEPRPAILSDPADSPIYVSGYFEIVREFMRGSPTKRAADVIAKIGPLQYTPDSVAALYSAIVKAVGDWTKEPGIGGDTATIILERGRSWRWYHRPDFCPEN
jgi:hypothetical protein